MYTIISLGGSLIVPKTGIDSAFLKRFRQLILSEIRRGSPGRAERAQATGRRFILIVGGGATARAYQEAFRNMWIQDRASTLGLRSLGPRGAVRDDKGLDDTLDWLGVHATVLNAQFVRLLFGDYAHHEVPMDPTKKIKTSKPIIVGSGWKPGWSSDYDAVLAAKTYGAREVINVSNIDYVYDKDPTKFRNVKPIRALSWPAYRAMVGDRWYPGSNAPFDPIAARAAASRGLTVKILNGRNLSNLRRAIQGKTFKGTTIA